MYVCMYSVPSDPICAFVSLDISKCEVICEYEGEIIPLEEAKKRESLYEKDRKACALMVIDSAGYQISRLCEY